jgi:hypothetical protein
MLRSMTRNQLRALAGIAALAAVALVAVPVLGVDPSRSPSTATVPSVAPASQSTAGSPSSAPASPAAAPTKSAEPDESDKQGGKPDKAAKPQHDKDTPEHPVTLTGVVANGTGEEGAFTLTVGSTVYALEAGPKWWWGDANPLAAAVGKTVTISGEQSDGSNDIDVQAIDGKAIRPAGRPPWAGGWKVVGPKHPGWAQWKVDKLAGKGAGRDHAPGQQGQPSPTP